MIHFDDFKLIPPRPLARLIAATVDDSPPPYRIERPVDVEDVPGARAWLFRHPGKGWLQCDDEARMQAARRLIFVVWLRARGGLSDG